MYLQERQNKYNDAENGTVPSSVPSDRQQLNHFARNTSYHLYGQKDFITTCIFQMSLIELHFNSTDLAPFSPYNSSKIEESSTTDE